MITVSKQVDIFIATEQHCSVQCAKLAGIQGQDSSHSAGYTLAENKLWSREGVETILASGQFAVAGLQHAAGSGAPCH